MEGTSRGWAMVRNAVIGLAISGGFYIGFSLIESSSDSSGSANIFDIVSAFIMIMAFVSNLLLILGAFFLITDNDSGKFLKKSLTEREELSRRSLVDATSIIGHMIALSSRRFSLIVTALFISLLMYFFFDVFVLDLNPVFLLFLFLYTIIVTTNQLIAQYRISKGYYGTTSSEAREIVQFIIDHSDDPDFPSGKKQIFPERDLEELRKTLPVPGGGEVQA
jgi:hypothetical protein